MQLALDISEKPEPVKTEKKKPMIIWINWLRSIAVYQVCFVHMLVALGQTVKFSKTEKQWYTFSIKCFV